MHGWHLYILDEVVSFQLQPAHFPEKYAAAIVETQERAWRCVVCKPCGSVFESGDEARHPSRGARKQDKGHRSYRNHRNHRSSNCEPVVRSSKSRPSFSVQGREENKILKCSMYQHVWLEAAGTSDHHQSWGGRTADLSEEPGYRLLPSEACLDWEAGKCGRLMLRSTNTGSKCITQTRVCEFETNYVTPDRDASSSHDICACTMGAQGTPKWYVFRDALFSVVPDLFLG